MDANKMPNYNLQLFGDAAGPAAPAAAPSAEGGSAAAETAGDTQPAGSRREQNAGPKIPQTGKTGRRKSGELACVVYGRQAEAPAGTAEAQMSSDAGSKTEDAGTAPMTPEARRAEFERLIGGEYKDFFTERTQQIIDRRFKETRGLQEQLAQMQPVLDMLKSKYGIDDNNAAKLREAIERDDAYWSKSAETVGMNVEQYKTVEKIKLENVELRRDQERRHGMEQAQRQYAEWMRQADEAKKSYPGLDLRAELAADPQFGQMLKNGIPVRHAYEVLHMDEIKSGLAQSVARSTEKQVVDNLRAKSARPSESGASGQSGVIVKADPKQWSKADRAEIIRRVERGAEIKF